jgi:hypothetical protein
MPSLATILIDGNGNGPRDWSSQDFSDVDEGISSADAAHIISLAGTDSNDTSFTIGSFPTDLGHVDSLSFDIRYRQSGRVDDTLGLSVRIMSGSTILAAEDILGDFQTVSSDIQTTTFINSGTVAFTYVNAAPLPDLWESAELEIRQIYTTSGGDDGAEIHVDTVDITGEYTQETTSGYAYTFGNTGVSSTDTTDGYAYTFGNLGTTLTDSTEGYAYTFALISLVVVQAIENEQSRTIRINSIIQPVDQVIENEQALGITPEGEVRVSQTVLEVGIIPNPEVRVSQYFIEVVIGEGPWVVGSVGMREGFLGGRWVG